MPINNKKTTKILRRKYPVALYREGNIPKIRGRNSLLELVEDTDFRPETDIEVVLKSYVSGVGNPGDIVTMKKQQAYQKLLVPGLADYPTPESLEYARNLKKDTLFQEKLMSPSVEWCKLYLERAHIAVVMNKENEWTLEPWHIRVSFRKAGIQILSDSSIELPSQPIRGPNMDLEGKEFYVTITINKKHKAKVRCCIHHWSTSLNDRIPFVENHWLLPKEFIFPEDNTKDEASTSPT